MADVVDAVTRSRMMAGIGPRNTRPEMIVRRALHAAGFRYRLHGRHLPGKPDLVLPRHHAVILVHGCFWHRHLHCRYSTTPATRPEFWEGKFAHNVERDRKVEAELMGLGWRVATVWECALRKDAAARSLMQLQDWLLADTSSRCEIGPPIAIRRPSARST